MIKNTLLILSWLCLPLLASAQDSGRLPLFTLAEGKTLNLVSRKMNTDSAYHATVKNEGGQMIISVVLKAAQPEDEVRTYWLTSSTTYQKENGQIYFYFSEKDASPTQIPAHRTVVAIYPETKRLGFCDKPVAAVFCNCKGGGDCDPELVINKDGTSYTRCKNDGCSPTSEGGNGKCEKTTKLGSNPHIVEQPPIIMLNCYDFTY